jgi:hypothetical protein
MRPCAWLRHSCCYIIGHDGGGPIRMALVLIPIWIINGLLFCGAFGAVFSGNGWGCLGWCCCIGPVLAFEVLFCVHADKGGFSNLPSDVAQGNHSPVSLAAVFAPLFVWAGICMITMIGACVSVYNNDRHSCIERCWDDYARPHEPLMENIP